MQLKEVKRLFRSGIATDKKALAHYSRDASLFEVAPKAIFFPKTTKDIQTLVKYVTAKKKTDPSLSLTARAAGTDMSGGPLNDSFIIDVTKHMRRLKKFSKKRITVEPGMYYRDFEKLTLKKRLLLPTYPASRELCALGGMVANNAGGEKSLRYGKTIDYVTTLKVVLADGKVYTLKPLSKKQLQKKRKQKTFEGQVYRKLYTLLQKHASFIKKAKPQVSKNSSGYNLWEIWDGKTFDLTKLFVGSQGTLGIVTEATFRLVKQQPSTGMVVIFCKDLTSVVDIVHTALPLNPSSFESFDDHSFRLALRFFHGFLGKLGVKNVFSLFFHFFPEFFYVLTHGLPKLTLLVEFEEATKEEVNKKIITLRKRLQEFLVTTKGLTHPKDLQKYWLMRRESFNLLRHKIKGKQTAPFIDDFIIRPEDLQVFLPKLIAILEKHKLLYTIIGHIGNANFHIIPLMVLTDERERKKIPVVSEKVYDLVLQFKGSITAEHNDGLIRSPYLQKMYGQKMCSLFKQVKTIFDPKGIFNPRKKVGSSLQYALEHIRRD